MNSLPVVPMVVILGFVAAITIGRWFLVAETLGDRLVNRALAWDLVGLVLFVCVGRLGAADLAFDLFTIFGAFAVANVFGFARSLDGGDPRTAVRRQRIYDGMAVAAGCVVLVGIMAARTDWGPTVWSLTTVPTAWSGLHITRACLRELRTAGIAAKERLTYGALLFVGGYAAVSTMVSLVRTANGTRPDEPGLPWVIGAYATLVLLTALIAIPLWYAVLARTELDRAGRCCRRLRPLWLALTDAVPEVVLARPSGGSASRLYRMTVEIRDALVRLRPYVPDVEAHTDIREYARGIARAVQAKAAGEAPAMASGRATPVDPRDRTDELRYLLALAVEWPKARALVRAGSNLRRAEPISPRWRRRAPACSADRAPTARSAG
ncbi:MAB_1171c family putative transporter [Nocardia sp. NPDC052112]|uniref:MAB_1171c family putative transporter n=1 Tax=Nocardia sp. NPDC052112 TaxID=3155646 RepID=UPI00343C80A5